MNYKLKGRCADLSARVDVCGASLSCAPGPFGGHGTGMAQWNARTRGARGASCRMRAGLSPFVRADPAPREVVRAGTDDQSVRRPEQAAGPGRLL